MRPPAWVSLSGRENSQEPHRSQEGQAAAAAPGNTGGRVRKGGGLEERSQSDRGSGTLGHLHLLAGRE